MGLTIENKSGTLSYNLGYGGFLRLREKIADLCSEEWGTHYKTLSKPPAVKKEDFYKAFDEKTKSLIDQNLVSAVVVDFCLQSDCDGNVVYKQCKEIYKHIKDYDDNICYGYAGQSDCLMFKDFKKLLETCIAHKSGFKWY